MIEPLETTFYRLRNALSSLKSSSGTGLDKLADYASGMGYGESEAKYWRGRRPESSDTTSLKAWMGELKQDDHIGPALELYKAAQLSRDPEWTILENGAPIPENDPLEGAMTQWHLQRGLLKELGKNAMSYLSLAQMVGRAYIPESYRADLQGNRTWTLEEALFIVHLQAVDRRQGGPLTDEHGRVVAYFYAYSIQNPVTLITVRLVELHLPERILTLLNPAGGLSFETLEDVPNPFPNSFTRSEYLMYHQDRIEGSIITSSVIDLQENINEETTYMNRNGKLAGYRMIITTNAEAEDDKGEPLRWRAGPGLVVNLRGLPDSTPNQFGQNLPGRATPSWGTLEPVNPNYHIDAISHYSSRLKRQLSVHWEDDTSRSVSAVSKRESRKGFEKRVAYAAQDLGLMMAWALKAVLTLAAQVMGDAAFIARVQNITFKPKLYLDISIADLGEYQVKLTAWQAGAISLESLLEATPGISDASVELEQIAEEKSGVEEGTAAFKVGDRVQVKAGMEHGAGMGGSGTVALVEGKFLGLKLDSAPDKIHKWYSSDEVEVVPGGSSMSKTMQM